MASFLALSACAAVSLTLCLAMPDFSLNNPIPQAVAPQRSCNWKVVGCFYDLKDGQNLLVGTRNQTFSATECRNLCTSHGYTHAGICNGIQCKCGNELAYTPETSTCCKARCYENPEENCGGPCYSIYEDKVKVEDVCSIIVSQCVYD